MRTATKRVIHKPHTNKQLSLVTKVNRASHHLKKDIDHYVTKRPYQAMGIFMLAGVAVGFLIRH